MLPALKAWSLNHWTIREVLPTPAILSGGFEGGGPSRRALPHFTDRKAESSTGHVQGWSESQSEGSHVGGWTWFLPGPSRVRATVSEEETCRLGKGRCPQGSLLDRSWPPATAGHRVTVGRGLPDEAASVRGCRA